MAYFIPYYIQKRLLRYALSRLDFIDTDALDLDKLEIAWGRKSTVELRDVALRREKLSAILQLPTSLRLQHAGIHRLRLTVPANLYAASIVVEIHGVEVKASLLSNEPVVKSSSKRRPSARPPRTAPPLPLSSATSPTYADSSSQDDESDGIASGLDDLLPNPHELAQSFLAEEPNEEREELRAAFQASSSKFSKAQPSQDVEDDGLAYGDNYGTGVALNLPGFLADFLKGILNRIQVLVSNISIKLDVPLESASDISSSQSDMKHPVETTFNVDIEDIHIHASGFLSSDRQSSHTQTQAETAKSPPVDATPESGFRYITFGRISASILSDTIGTSQLSQVLDTSIQNKQSGNVADPKARSIDTPQQHVIPEVRSWENQTAKTSAFSDMKDSVILQKDQPPTEPDMYSSASSMASISPESLQSSLYSSQPKDNFSNVHGALRRFREERSLTTSKRSSRDSQIMSDIENLAALNPPSSPVVAMPVVFSHQVATTPPLDFQDEQDQGLDEIAETGDNARDIDTTDDMLESRLYSHDEAESIYMSAIGDFEQPDSTFRSIFTQAMDDSEPVQTENGQASTSSTSQHLKLSSEVSLRRKEFLAQSTTNPSIALPPQSPLPTDILPQVQPTSGSPVENIDTTAEDRTSVESPAVSARPLFQISGARIRLPDLNQDSKAMSEEPIAAVNRSLDDPIYSEQKPHMPGSFSLYAESRSSMLRSGTASRPVTHLSVSQERRQNPEALVEIQKRVIEVSLDTVSTSIDAASIKSLSQLGSKLQSAISIDVQVESHAKDQMDSTRQRHVKTGLSLKLKSLEVDIVEGLADRSPTYSSTSSAPMNSFGSGTDSTLFKLSLKDLNLTLDDINSASHTMLEVGIFRLGFEDENIISLTRESRLRTSLHDVREVQDKDIRVEINKVNEVPDINIVTQPLSLKINLQKLDSTLGSVGGLSALLELGSSILSDTTVTGNAPESHSRQRTVRFETPTENLPEKFPSHRPRLNIKISGCSLTIEGKQSSVVYQSSAIKVVGRNTLVGVQVDDMKLSGPHQYPLNNIIPTILRARETKFKYLFTPEEHDLTRLISLLTPSKDKFEDDDDFLVDTLIKQRKKGSVLRVNVSTLEAACLDPKTIDLLRNFGSEISKMSSVTKFLPKESRPGLMTLGLIDTVSLKFGTGLKIGEIVSELKNAEVAHVSAPSLVALAIDKMFVNSETHGKLITETCRQDVQAGSFPPMLMMRMIEDELEPSIKLKAWNLCLEYSVPALIALMDQDSDATREDLEIDLTTSISALAEARAFSATSSPVSERSQSIRSDFKPMNLDVALRDCAIGLTPRQMPSKATFVLGDARLFTNLPRPESKVVVNLTLKKADLLLVDDVKHLTVDDQPEQLRPAQLPRAPASLIDRMCHQGYVSVTSISAASILVSVVPTTHDQPEILDVELKIKLFVLETCADSTQTLIETLNSLAPPAKPTPGQKYRTEVAPVEDMVASFTGDAFAVVATENTVQSEIDNEDYMSTELNVDYDRFISDTDMYPESGPEDTIEDFEDYYSGAIDLDDTPRQSVNPDYRSSHAGEAVSGAFAPADMPPQLHATASKWDSRNNRYVPVRKSELQTSPLRVRVRDTHIIWNLFDGYDWERTRDTITKAVHDIETRAEEKRSSRRTVLDENDDEEPVIGDFLFNSIYIGIPINSDPKELSRQINGNLDDLTSETGSHTPSHTSGTTVSRASNSPRPRARPRKLKLNRSKRHKIAFELRGASIDHFAFIPGNETQSSTDVRVEHVEIFDHVPTSTWKKFATYMQDAGPREDRKPMLHLEVCDVRPVPELTATELVIRVTILPLRLHVDQDALDFITRFFEFNDSSQPSQQDTSDQPYLQRVEVRPIPVKLDYKPKKVDYAGLRSGRTTEFMNFFNLDAAEFVLKHVVVYGTSGFMKLHRSLEDVWMPDVKLNQLPTVLSGLNGVRTIVNIGVGVRDLINIPIQEYKKDGRIVRSISKGALAFARTTGSELTRFGAKVAIGAQTALQEAEGYLVGHNPAYESGWEDSDLDSEEKRAISYYANHPAGILQGLKGAARSLERDLLVTRDVIVAISSEVRESDSAEGAAKAVARHAPTLVLRPVIGASKAISQTLMGATNTVDPANKRRIEDKYKRY